MKQKWVKSADWFYNEATNFMEYAEIMEMMEIPSSELCQFMTPTHSFFEYISRMFTDISQRHLKEGTLSFDSNKDRKKRVFVLLRWWLNISMRTLKCYR